MHEVDRDRSFADGRRHICFTLPAPDIPVPQTPPARLVSKELRRARQRPRLLFQRRTVEIVAGWGIEARCCRALHTSEPCRARRGTGHHEEMAYVVRDNLPAIAIAPADAPPGVRCRRRWRSPCCNAAQSPHFLRCAKSGSATLCRPACPSAPACKPCAPFPDR